MRKRYPNSVSTGKIVLILLASAMVSALRAAEITDAQAAVAVQAWINEGSSMGRLANAEVDSSATVETASGRASTS